MLVEHKDIANKWLLIGYGTWFLGNVLRSFDNNIFYVGSLLFGLGFVIFIYGCMNYALAKGYSKYYGLLGVFSLFGLAVLYLIEDKNKTNSTSSSGLTLSKFVKLFVLLVLTILTIAIISGVIRVRNHNRINYNNTLQSN